MVRDGLLGPDGVAVTRLGLLLAGVPERRRDEDHVVLEFDGRCIELTRGLLLVRDDVRDEVRAAGVHHADNIAGLVFDLLVRTAMPLSVGPTVGRRVLGSGDRGDAIAAR